MYPCTCTFVYYNAHPAGKGVGLAKAVDVGTAVKILRYYAGWTDKIESRVVPSDPKLLTYTRYQPLGVVAGILPFNFPMLGAVCKLAPALAAGNTIVLKSAEKTPLGTLLLAALVQKVGFPKGVVNILSGYGPSCGGPLVAHPRVAKVCTLYGGTGMQSLYCDGVVVCLQVTFTGSNAVGKAIQKVAADTLKRGMP
jgi:aldehyde dehydrogenase (NAD+)